MRELLQQMEKEHGDPAKFRLAFVCLTHPHDDHYAGLGRLLDAFRERVDEVWTVLHVTPQYREALVTWTEKERKRRASQGKGSGPKEMPDIEDVTGLERVLTGFDAAWTQYGSRLVHLSHNQLLYERTIGSNPLSIKACGPAAGDLAQAVNGLLASLNLGRRRQPQPLRSYDPNLTSGALLIQWGKSAVLLGGDLLCGSGPNSGWQLAGTIIKGEVQVVNVAHHASKEAHDEALWSRMKPALAIVTPFKFAAGNQPPKPAQITALAQSSVIAITSPPAWESASGNPSRMHPRQSPVRQFDPKNSALDLTPSRDERDIHNAVAVSLDAFGKITRFVLAGEADVYLAPGELASRPGQLGDPGAP
ncbi:MAG TPA: MBL fold metallo-hydrolase [Polyangiaceae bacterium]|nr:MBL fold metallo-hydrolase [Polyangiaceae bacterium]